MIPESIRQSFFYDGVFWRSPARLAEQGRREQARRDALERRSGEHHARIRQAADDFAAQMGAVRTAATDTDEQMELLRLALVRANISTNDWQWRA